ncbi:MAG: hypothetical protein ACLRP8_06610 [Roseburia intestinalis]
MTVASVEFSHEWVIGGCGGGEMPKSIMIGNICLIDQYDTFIEK